MINRPLVSIIVIAYNNADTIEECLLSILNQNYPFKESLVVYDEGSNDGTIGVLQRLSKVRKDALRIISTPHVGRSKARNMGWKSSLGEVLFFADADDVYHEDYLEKAVSQLVSDPKMGGVCLTGSSLTSGHGLVSGCMEVYSKIQQSIVESGAFKPSWAWVYRREAIEKVDGFDEKLDQAEDRDLLIRVVEEGYGVGLITGVNWLHRRPSSLISHLKKSYLGGKRRILFIAKYGKWGDLLHYLLPFWLLLTLVTLSFFNIILVIPISMGLILFVSIRAVHTAKIAWRKIESKRYVLLYPFFNLITYLFSAAGHTHGLLLFLLKKG